MYALLRSECEVVKVTAIFDYDREWDEYSHAVSFDDVQCDALYVVEYKGSKSAIVVGRDIKRGRHAALCALRLEMYEKLDALEAQIRECEGERNVCI